MKRAAFLFITFLFLAVSAFAQVESIILVRSNGELGSRDPVYQGEPVDWYQVTAPEDGRLRIVALSVDFEPALLIQTGAGTTETRPGQREVARATQMVIGGETVSVGVTASRITNDAWEMDPQYTIQVIFETGEISLSTGGYLDGDLELGDEQDSGGEYIDWYPLLLVAGDRIRVDLRSPVFDTYLYVDLPDGQSLSDDDGGGGTDSSVSFTATQSGTARVGVSSYGSGETGPYTVYVSEEVVYPISVGETVQARLEGGSTLFSVQGEPGQVVDVSASSNVFDVVLELEDAYGQYLYADYYTTADGAQFTYVFGDSGVADITVSSYGGQGPFELSVFESDVVFETPVDGFELSGGETINGIITTGSPSLDGYYHQRFTFFAEAGERVEITLESDSFDAFLRLVSPGGRETTDDDGAGNLNSRILFNVTESGVHEIYARPLGYDDTGLYTLTFRRLGEGRQVLDRRGQLTPNDPVDENGVANDVYEVELREGASVVIDVMSDSFDTRATLQDEFGAFLDSDDDGGSGSNSRISFTPEWSGIYRVVVSSYSGGQYGNYHIEIWE